MSDFPLINDYFYPLLKYFGPQHWWPGETIDEIIIGAVLTQNTNWINVEKAIDNLKREGFLDLKKIPKLDEKKLANLIKPSGYYNIKAKRLKSVASFFAPYKKNNFSEIKNLNPQELRNNLLSIYGVGRETADSILLYAFNMPFFVVDAYTLRFGIRHNFFSENINYEKVRNFFEERLPRDYKIYNEFHALIVQIGKNFCKPKPLCENCPIKK